MIIKSDKMEPIHLWQFPPAKLYIMLEDGYREDFFNTALYIANNFSGKGSNSLKLSHWLKKRAKQYNLSVSNYSAIYPWRRGWEWRYKNNKKERESRYTPLWVALEISKLISKNNKSLSKKFNYRRLERHTISYRSEAGKIIRNAKLPIKITPELDSIIIHMFCDGSYVPKKQPKYTQIKEANREKFIQKVKLCFGDFSFPKISYERGDVLFPAAIMHILSKYYKIPSFLGSDARVPLELMGRPWKHKLAALCALLIDEGTIRPGGEINIYSSNNLFLNDFISLISKPHNSRLGYSCSKVKRDLRGLYSFSISNKSAEKLLKDIKKLKIFNPLCGLDIDKEAALEFTVKNQRRIFYNRKSGVSKKLILDELKRRPQTSRELAFKIDISSSEIRRHLLELEKSKKVKRLSKNRNGILWDSIKK